MFICNLPPAPLAEWQGSFTCYCGNTGWRGGGGGGTSTEIRVSTESWPWRRRFSRRSCRGLEPPNFRSRVWRSNHWAVLAPQAAGSQTFPAIFVLGMSEQLLMRFTKQTDLGKCTHLYDEAQGTMKHKCKNIDSNKRRRKQRRRQARFWTFFFTSSPSCLSFSLLPSSFIIIYLSSCTWRRQFCVGSACVSLCFVV